jgi:hypothetical protein
MAVMVMVMVEGEKDVFMNPVCLFVRGSAHPILPKYFFYFFFFSFFVSAPHKVTTDFTLTPLPSNSHQLCRAVILCAVRKFGFFSCQPALPQVAWLPAHDIPRSEKSKKSRIGLKSEF